VAILVYDVADRRTF
jgi:GTPase SAR1 family protein